MIISAGINWVEVIDVKTVREGSSAVETSPKIKIFPVSTQLGSTNWARVGRENNCATVLIACTPRFSVMGVGASAACGTKPCVLPSHERHRPLTLLTDGPSPYWTARALVLGVVLGMARLAPSLPPIPFVPSVPAELLQPLRLPALCARLRDHCQRSLPQTTKSPRLRGTGGGYNWRYLLGLTFARALTPATAGTRAARMVPAMPSAPA